MTNDLTDVRNRLLPPSRLRQVKALLNMPHTDETDTQQAALYAAIAGWAQLSAQAAEQRGTPDTAETVAQTVLTRYLTHLAQHRDNYELWLVDSLSLRASVWHADTAASYPRARRPNCPLSAHVFSDAAIPPHAIEIRTPTQIHRFMNQAPLAQWHPCIRPLRTAR